MEKQTIETPTEARQGARGTGLRYVLIGGLDVVIAFVVVYILMV
jgi:hypothetical protein